MPQYINKAAAVAEIEKLQKRYSECKTRNIYEEGLKEGRLIGYKDALHKLGIIEVKDVDLEKELGKYLDANDIEFSHQIKLLDFAKHFFELGLKAKSNLDSVYKKLIIS